MFCRRHRARYPRRVSAGKTPARHPRNPAMQLGKRPERRQDPDRMRTAHRPRPASTHGSTDDGGAEDRPRQHAQQADPPRLDSSPPRPADPAHRQRPPRSTAAPSPAARPRYRPRQQDRPTARHSPTEPGQRTPRPDARRQHPRRPGRLQEPPRAALLLYTSISSDRQPQRPTMDRRTAGRTTPARRPSTN